MSVLRLLSDRAGCGGVAVAVEEIMLMYCQGNVFQGPNEAMMTRLNATMPEGCEFFLENPSTNADGTTYYCKGIGLRVRAEIGTRILVR